MEKLGHMFKHEFLKKFQLEMVTLETGRYYLNPETGEKFDSVTTILKNGYDQTWLLEWKERVGYDVAKDISERARERGTWFHKKLEDYVHGIETDEKISQSNRKALRYIKSRLDRDLSLVYGIELQVYSRRLQTAGTADLFCQWRGKNTILDYKTSRNWKKPNDIPHYFVQAAVYANMMKELYGMDVPQLVVVMIYPHGEPDFFETETEKYQNEVERIFINERNIRTEG